MAMREGLRRAVLVIGGVISAGTLVGMLAITPLRPEYDQWTEAIKAASQRDIDPSPNPRFRPEWNPSDHGMAFIESNCTEPPAASHVKAVCIAYAEEEQQQISRAIKHAVKAFALAAGLFLMFFVLARLVDWVLAGFQRSSSQDQ